MLKYFKETNTTTPSANTATKTNTTHCKKYGRDIINPYNSFTFFRFKLFTIQSNYIEASKLASSFTY